MTRIQEFLIAIVMLGLSSTAGFARNGNQSVIKPSFDCQEASTKVEHLICSDSNLALSDLILNDLYLIAKKENSNIRDEQRKWLLEERNNNCLRRKQYLIANLSLCYRNRIRELSEHITIPETLREKYTKLLLSNKMFALPSAIKEPEKRFIIQNNLNYAVTHMLGACEDNGMSVRFWDGKHLIVSNHSSSVECTGRSVHGFWDSTYCLLNNEFIPTNNDFFSCPDPYAIQEVTRLGTTYLENHVNDLIGSDKFKEGILRQILRIVSETKNPYLTGNWLYSNEIMNFVLENTNKVSTLSKPYEVAIINLLGDLIKVHDSIITNPDWENKFASYKPYHSSHYMDTSYNQVSEGFNVVPGISQERVARYIHYTYHELYHRFWYKCYKQKSTQLAYKAITKLHESLLKWNKNETR